MASLPVLNGHFRPREHYRSNTPNYQLLPFRFERLAGERVLLTNFAGDFATIPAALLSSLVNGSLDRETELFQTLVARHFVMEGNFPGALEVLATQYRTRYSALAEFTALHLFVVTLRCDHSCPYCQVSRVSGDKVAYDMTPETALKALELVFRSPSPVLKIEFQGGESLLNFELIRIIVERAEERAAVEGRRIEFVVATNLSPLTDEMLDFFRDHRVLVSTSLDGPARLHNANRPRPGGDSFERTIHGIERCRAALGEDSVSALMTTTRRSLDAPEEIIDEYVKQGFRSVFLRWLSPFGFAVRSQTAIGYSTKEWNHFYERGLQHVLQLNRKGTSFREDFATIVLRKMLTPFASGYVDLTSPSALATGVVVYNYDGDVYASDESRMLAETGDHTFRLGNVHRDSYEALFGSEALLRWIDETMTEAVPQCETCAFEPWCGTDPVFHHATQGDAVGHRPTSAFCARNMFAFRLLIDLLESDPFAAKTLRRWASP